jgi:PAS domain S-box-containing protein
MFEYYHRLSLQKKLLVFMMSLVLFLGSVMGLIIRFAIFPHLIHDMEGRGAAAAGRLAENSRGFILARNVDSLAAMLFEEKALDSAIAYIVVTDGENRMLAHTFAAGAFHDGDPLLSDKDDRTQHGLRFLTPALQGSISEIVAPVDDGPNRIGTVRLGIDKRLIENVIQKLTYYHLGFVGLITLLGILFGLRLSKIITRPISSLTRLAGEISRGNLNTYITLGSGKMSWDLMKCGENHCPLLPYDSAPPHDAGAAASGPPPIVDGRSQGDKCRECRVHQPRQGDEITQLANAFNHMTRRLWVYETELRLSEQRYRLLFNRDPNPIFVVASESCFIMDANERASEQYGYTQNELLGMRFTELGIEDDSADVIASFAGPHQEDKPCSLLPKIRHRRKTGTVFWVNAYFCGYEYMGKPAVIATTTDVTRIIDTETRLIQAGKMATLGEMSAGVAHELNQPLNAIKLGGEFLLTMAELGKPIPEEDLKQVARDMSKEVDRAAGIINHLREFGRKSDVSKHGMDLNIPIKGALTILGQQLRAHGVELVLELDETLPPILADENRIEQVLINLINNARDAMDANRELSMPAGGPVLTIRSYAANGRVMVSVGDNGTGIREANRERVFEPFFTTKAVGKGTGLGLSISYGIVGDYDGAIDFETEENVGTVFRLSFPEAPKGART